MSLSLFLDALARKSRDLSEQDKRSRYSAVISARVTATYTAITNATTQDQTVTVSGVAIGSIVELGCPVLAAGLVVTAFVSAANTITIRIANLSGGSVTPGALTFNLLAIRP